MSDAASAGRPARRSSRHLALTAKLLDQAALCDRIAAEVNFDEHRLALLAMAAEWRKAAAVVQVRSS
jgi:hypothetical protein